MKEIASQPRKVRKALFTAPLHKKRKMLSAHLSEELMLKYNLRSLPVRKGDMIKVMRGTFKGHIGKIANVDTSSRKITIEGITIAKSDKAQVAKPMDPSNVLITKLDLSDPLRSKKLELRKEKIKIERKRKKKEKKEEPKEKETEKGKVEKEKEVEKKEIEERKEEKKPEEEKRAIVEEKGEKKIEEQEKKTEKEVKDVIKTEMIKNQIIECKLCPIVDPVRTITYPRGIFDAKVAFIGEGPSFDDSLPKIRPALELSKSVREPIKDVIELFKVSEEECYFTNIVKCGNRETKEYGNVDICVNRFLKSELSKLKLRIVAVGKESHKRLASLGICHTHIKHPSMVLRGLMSKEDYLNEIKRTIEKEKAAEKKEPGKSEEKEETKEKGRTEEKKTKEKTVKKEEEKLKEEEKATGEKEFEKSSEEEKGDKK